jgi:hypothetical protein
LNKKVLGVIFSSLVITSFLVVGFTYPITTVRPSKINLYIRFPANSIPLVVVLVDKASGAQIDERYESDFSEPFTDCEYYELGKCVTSDVVQRRQVLIGPVNVRATVNGTYFGEKSVSYRERILRYTLTIQLPNRPLCYYYPLTVEFYQTSQFGDTVGIVVVYDLRQLCTEYPEKPSA